MIYAYKEGAYQQSLQEHIDKCLEALKGLVVSPLWSVDFDQGNVRMVLVYHDIGKIFYQKQKQDLIFTGHEFISAYIFWKVFERKLERNDILYMFPIIFHHHSMGIQRRLQRVENDLNLSKPSNELLQELETMLLDKYIQDESIVRETIGAIEKFDITTSLRKVKQKIEEKINEIWREFHGTFARNALRLLLITILCDYEGSKDRGKSSAEWIFGEVLEEFFQIYSRKC
jgi:CRISPR/Cas system-associated endonuclease Cas3-HD